MMFFVLPVIMGILSALFFVGHAMMTIPDPYQRVAFYLTILSSELMAVILAYALLGPSMELFIFTFSFTQCLIWSIMDKKAMVFANSEEE
jgi:uncharacterized membrane protein